MQAVTNSFLLLLAMHLLLLAMHLLLLEYRSCNHFSTSTQDGTTGGAEERSAAHHLPENHDAPLLCFRAHAEKRPAKDVVRRKDTKDARDTKDGLLLGAMFATRGSWPYY